MRELKPYHQGSLDSLCGIYSIINSIHHLHGPLRLDDAIELFMQVIQQLELKANSALVRLEEGTTTPEISKGLHFAALHYPIRWARPFHQRKQLTLDDYWQQAQTFIEEQQGVLIINVIKGERLNHWTVVHHISNHSLFLLDPEGMKRVYRRHCTVDEDDSQRIYLNPNASFFIRKATQDQEKDHD